MNLENLWGQIPSYILLLGKVLNCKSSELNLYKNSKKRESVAKEIFRVEGQPEGAAGVSKEQNLATNLLATYIKPWKKDLAQTPQEETLLCLGSNLEPTLGFRRILFWEWFYS